ncbi:MAG: hypothetical protein ACI89U_001838, partial [Gammaproteobacteria bacterium]
MNSTLAKAPAESMLYCLRRLIARSLPYIHELYLCIMASNELTRHRGAAMLFDT